MSAGAHTLVYLHGLLIDSEVNRGIAGALAARGHRVVLLDLLGHGRSDKVPQVRGQEFGRDLAELVRRLDLHDVVGVGHSAGLRSRAGPVD